MNVSLHNNLLMINSGNQYKINFGKETKAAEKLASGYRINRAADDAAGLQISEKMRAQIRALYQGSNNAWDGVSWLQTGEGALSEVQEMLHRMKELTVKSLNDTNTLEDRAAIQAEFDALQSEIDYIFDTTEFNKQKIFAAHEPTYYQFEGNVVWQQNQTHVISGGANDLIVECLKDGSGSPETITVTVPAGVYTTQELIDELDDAIAKSGAREKGLVMEYTEDGTCNLNFEGGEQIERVGGELAYLLYDVYEGGSMGALIGTTVFTSEYSELEIASVNNQLSFDIESFGGTSKKINMTLPSGYYTKQKLIDMLNEKLDGTSVKAVEYGTGIKLTSNDSIITRFKGNMFKIDEGLDVYTSVFYDNVKYGNVTMGAASFLGGGVLPTDSRDEEHKYYVINANNNQLDFQANGSSKTVTITIPEGKYTAGEMVSKLNQLFAEKKLELNASIRTTGGYQGIRIDSMVKGVVSKVGVDKNSSGFHTLFVDRSYNAYVDDAAYSREYSADKGAVFQGAKSFTGSALPLEITGSNNTFQLSLTNASGTSTHTITLAAGRYTTAQAVAGAINVQLSANTAPAAYKGLVKASVEDGKIVLTGTDGVTAVSASANSGSTGYNDIFVLNRVNYVKQDISGRTVTTNTAIPDGTVIKPGDNTLQVSVGGNGYNITLPTGNNVTHKDITNAIENAVQEKSVTAPNTFSDVNGRGSSTDANFTVSGEGKTVVKNSNYMGEGLSLRDEGKVGSFIYNNPAKVTITPALSDTTVVTKENNQIQLQILKDGDIKNITIPDGTYNRQGLAKAIQNQIDAVFGKYIGGAVISVNGSGQLELEARLNKLNGEMDEGKKTRITCSTGTSSFLRELNTTRSAAQITSSEALKNSITVADDCNSLSISYVENGVSKTADIVLSNGSYSRTGIKDEINRKLKAAGAGVTAALSGSYLVLETNAKGKGNSISFNTRSGGSAVEALFGALTSERSARAAANADMQEKIRIDGTSNTFQMKVNGSPCNLILDSGEYSRSEFVNMLNRKFMDANAGITAFLDGKRLAFETDKTGRGASFNITYSTGGTSMKAIYGESTTVTPGLKASFTPDGRLSLTSTTGNANIKLSSNSGSVFQEPLAVPETVNPSSFSGYYSKKNCYIDGVNLSGPVTIDEWNNDLKFDYYTDGQKKEVSISVPEKADYTFAELQTVLQNLLDAKLGLGQVKVTVKDTGVRIETEKPGSKYYMASFAGDFYDKVLCSTKERSEVQKAEEKNGSQTSDLAYTVGRQDVRNGITELKAGFSDTLTLDFTYGGAVRTLSMKLTPGEYDGNSLAEEIQKQLNKSLVDAGFEENTIEVGIGGVNTGVVGSNDNNALVFKLSSSVRLPGNGQYIIDGVGGNAAFSVFYQTDGKMDPAYIKGTKDISDGVIIEAGKDQFSFEVDGTEYRIAVPEGSYTSAEIINTVNQQLQGIGAPVTADVEDGRLVLRHNNLGSYKIGNVKGAAKQALFFQENGAKDERKEIMLQLSGKLPDYAVMEQRTVNTVFLGINSITVSAPKYAEKALDRLEEALNKVSAIRSDFGSKQNQLERAINNNGNEAENTQVAESRLRDADMAEVMVGFSKANILKQTAQSMMIHSDMVSEGVLRLLK